LTVGAELEKNLKSSYKIRRFMVGGLQQKEKQAPPVDLIGIALFLTSGGFPV
jgi:hypothetical protein